MKNRKNWAALKGENSWTMFKVVSEFVESFERMNKLGPAVSIFGSARTQPGEPMYDLAVKIARVLTDEGFGIITGGGPGIMEAGNKGAFDIGGESIGLSINLPFEQGHNDFIDKDKIISFNYFFVRKVIFVKYAQAFVVLPGGFGTMDELFEVLTLIQTKKISAVPVVLVGKEYWSGLKEWVAKVMYGQAKNINEEDIDLLPIVDTPQEVLKVITDFYSDKQVDHQLKPNYNL